MSDYTFDVDHHGRSTDSVLVRDEISKAAYRAAKAWELVASTELAETRSECDRLREQLATEQQRHGVVIDDFQQQLRIVAKEREEIDRLRKQIKAADELAAAVASVEGCNFTHSFYDHLMSKMDAYRASRGQA